MDVYSTDDVFGVSRDLPLNYQIRDVDRHFLDNLLRHKHVVVFGSSKQGKTSLRKKNLQERDYILVHCLRSWSLAELHSSILKQAGYQVEVSNSRTVSGEQKIQVKIAGEYGPISGNYKNEESSKEENTVQYRPLELDPSDVNDVVKGLANIKFDKFIILEDFHYLPLETQKQFAFSLKAFHELSKYTFIIVGVWREENRLIVFNGDLSGRIISVNADKWEEDELNQVIKNGEILLNITFEHNFKKTLVGSCFKSVYIVQEACRRACQNAAIYSTREAKTEIGRGVDVQLIIKDIVNESTSRYTSFLRDFASGFHDTQLKMYKWIVFTILSSMTKKLEDGLKYAEIRKIFREHHPEGDRLNLGNLTIALQKVASLQVEIGIKPIVIDYDSTNTVLSVVDRGFLIWLENQDRKELFALI